MAAQPPRPTARIMGIIRIAVTGPECSGKSELTERLSQYFDVPKTEEYAREYLCARGGTYAEKDLTEICKGQLAAEDAAVSRAERMAIFDTDMTVLKIWSMFRFGSVPHFIGQADLQRVYHLKLLCRPDLPWEPDPLRESPDPRERDLLFGIFKRHLEAGSVPFEIVEGTGEERFRKAISLVERHFAAV